MAASERSKGTFSAGEIAKMRPNGVFLQLDDIVFYVLFCEIRGKGNRSWITMHIRELLSGEISNILIGWNHTDAVPSYLTTYMSTSYRAGAEKNDQYETYSFKKRNATFQMLDLELRTCLYKGNYICMDLKNGNEYSFAHSPKRIKKELSNLKVGDITNVCRFQGIDFFVASYRLAHPIIKKYDKAKRILLKKGMKYKLSAAQIGKCYRASCIDGYNFRAEYKYPPYFNGLSMDVCEEVKIAYGYANGLVIGGKKEVIFTNIVDYKSYPIPIETIGDEDFEALCEDSYIVKASIALNGSYQAYLEKVYQTEELGELEYLYENEGKAYCMNGFTYELHEIPLRYMPRGLKENESLYGSAAEDEELKAVDPTGRIYALHRK